jgi:hypothetical protein
MKSGWISSVFLLAVVAASGCGGEGPSNDDGQLGKNQAAVGECPASETLGVGTVNGPYSLALHPTNTHVCWLTGVWGRFDGQRSCPDGVSVQAHANGWWYLEARNSEEYGEARCAPLSCFTGDGVNDVVWDSTDNFSAIAAADGPTCDNYQSNAWWGDAATIEQYWPGCSDTEGGGEYTAISQSNLPFSSSKVVANDCTSDGLGRIINSFGTSLFVGTPSGGKACHFTGSPFSVSGNYTLNLNVYTDEAICYFTKISGKFRGGGEFVKVYPVSVGGGRYKWYAKSTQGGDGSAVSASGRCFWFHQWDL